MLYLRWLCTISQFKSMSSTRQKILESILKAHRCTVSELAEQLGFNPISIRHHLIKLEAEGLIQAEDQRNGVGRPRQVFSLTEAGLELFPTRYLQLTSRLLERIKQSLPEGGIEAIFSEMGADVVRNYSSVSPIENLPFEERLDLLREILAKEGFTVEWEKKGDAYHINELNCPYYQIGISHPEVCTVDRAVISGVLDVPATRINCILNGDSFCTYVVPIIANSDIPFLENSPAD